MSISGETQMINSRTAGTMPVWGQKHNITQTAKTQPTKQSYQHGAETLTLDTKTQDYNSSLRIPDKQTSPLTTNGAAKDSISFADLLDVINPLQHIPIVNNFYRGFTGDQIKPFARIAGAGIFGGGIGAAAATANVFLEAQSGQDVSGHVMGYVSKGKNSSSTQNLQVARDYATNQYVHAQNSRYNG
jgi:hypothetical protein